MNKINLNEAFYEGQRRARARAEEEEDEGQSTSARSSECCGARVLMSDAGIVCVHCGKVQD